MARGGHVWLVLVAVAVSGCDREAESPPPALDSDADRPNILLYMADTLRADCLGCYGHPVIETPAVDRLAREGTLFENAFAQSSWTRPSIATILTSLYPSVHGVQQRSDALSENALLLSETAKKKGYTTCCITTNPNVGSSFGFNQGFDDFIELYARRDPGFVRTTELTTTCDKVTQRAVEWISQARQPFLLVILTIDPHSPYTPPAEYDRYGGDYAGSADGKGPTLRRPNLSPADKERVRSLYYGEIAFNDRAFGGLCDYLRTARLDDRTIIAFTSDHGEEFWEHRERGHGKALYDESIHVPLVIRYPKTVPADARVARPVQTVDICPTLLELAHLPIPDDLDGCPLFGGGAEADTAVFSSLDHDGRSLVALRDYPWKLILDLESGDKYLFNLAESPLELVNMIGTHAEQVERLEKRIARFVRRNMGRHAKFRGSHGPPQVSEEQLSEDALRTLRALGYVGEADDDE